MLARDRKVVSVFSLLRIVLFYSCPATCRCRAADFISLSPIVMEVRNLNINLCNLFIHNVTLKSSWHCCTQFDQFNVTKQSKSLCIFSRLVSRDHQRAIHISLHIHTHSTSHEQIHSRKARVMINKINKQQKQNFAAAQQFSNSSTFEAMWVSHIRLSWRHVEHMSRVQWNDRCWVEWRRTFDGCTHDMFYQAQFINFLKRSRKESGNCGEDDLAFTSTLIWNNKSF